MELSLTVLETFPVQSLDVLDVTFSCTDNKMAVGDNSVTCFGGTHFLYSQTPACIAQGTNLFWFIASILGHKFHCVLILLHMKFLSHLNVGKDPQEMKLRLIYAY